MKKNCCKKSILVLKINNSSLVGSGQMIFGTDRLAFNLKPTAH